MKIGTITEQFQLHYSSDEIFSRLKQIGYDGVDYTLGIVRKQPDSIFLKPRAEWVNYFMEIGKSMKNNGIEPFQVHATYPTDFDGARCLTDSVLDQFKREIEAAALIGSPYIVIHPINLAKYDKDKELDFRTNMEAFSKFEPTLREFGVKLGVENMFSYDDVRRRQAPTGCSSPEDMIRYIDSMHSEYFVACLDTGHMLINCHSPAEAVRKLGSRLKLMHVHDNYGIRDEHNAPTQGITDWHEFISAIKEIGYDGAFCMEISYKSVANVCPELMWDYARFAFEAAKKIIGE